MSPEDIKVEEEKLLAEVNSDLEKKFPSIFVQFRNVMKQAWLSGTDAIKGKGLLSSPEKARARLDICESCEFYLNHRCLKCGCFMEKKIHLESAQCPLNKWGDLQTPTSMKEMFPMYKFVDIESFPEEERERVKEIAAHAASTKQIFRYNGKQYTSKVYENGVVEIYNHGEEPKPNSPPRETRTITSRFSSEEMVEFNALVEQAKTSDNKVFSFKGEKFKVTVTGNRTNIGLG